MFNMGKSNANGASMACSADTAAEIDRQVVELVKARHEKAVKILTENRQKRDTLASFFYRIIMRRLHRLDNSDGVS